MHTSWLYLNDIVIKPTCYTILSSQRVAAQSLEVYTRRAFYTVAQLFNCMLFLAYNARCNVSKYVHVVTIGLM